MPRIFPCPQICLLLTLSFVMLTVWSTIANAAVTVSIQDNGSGSYQLQGSEFNQIVELDILIDYEGEKGRVPKLLLAHRDLQREYRLNTDIPGTVSLKIKSALPINGTHRLTSITGMDRVTSLSVSALNSRGDREAVQVTIVNPPDSERRSAKSEPLGQSKTAARTPLPKETVSESRVAQVKEGSAPEQPKTATPVVRKRDGVLNRFLRHTGPESTTVLAAIVLGLEMDDFRQYPPVLLSDGVATAVVSFSLPGDETVLRFKVDGGRCLKAEPAAPGVWQLQIQPERGRLETTVTVLDSIGNMTLYPLTVAPLLKEYAAKAKPGPQQQKITTFVRLANQLATTEFKKHFK